MRLCDKDIKKWINEKKLIVKPKPNFKNINGVTIDLHLSNKFRIFHPKNSRSVDLSKIEKFRLNSIVSKEIKISRNNTFILHPQEFVLAITHEYLVIPNELVGWLDGKSSLARFGLMIHVTAHRIDPGWSGSIVLECFNLNKIILELRPRMKIGAISFELLSHRADNAYNFLKNSRYKHQKKII